MKLRFLGKNSTPGDSPTLYASDEDSYVIQGWKVFANDLLMQLDVPEGQTVIEVPPELFEHLTNDGSKGMPPSNWTRQQTNPRPSTWGFTMERVTRIELALSAWEAAVI